MVLSTKREINPTLLKRVASDVNETVIRINGQSSLLGGSALDKIRIGTRTSTLAMWQAAHVQQKLEQSGYTTEIIGITSTGDKSLGETLQLQLANLSTQ